MVGWHLSFLSIWKKVKLIGGVSAHSHAHESESEERPKLKHVFRVHFNFQSIFDFLVL